MLRNYLKIAFRNLRKNKIDSVISIGGLAVGIACCILLALSVQFELTYDNFHKNGDRLFRVTETDTTSKGEVRHDLVHPYPMATALDSTYPEIKRTIRLSRTMLQVKRGNKFYNEPGALLAGPEFFQMFSFPLIAGNENTALSDPNSIVLSQKMAQKLFDTEQAMGKVVTFRQNGEERSYNVTGIAKNVPANSSIIFDIVLPFDNVYLGDSTEMENRSRTSWYEGNNIIWVVLEENASAANLENKFSGFLKNYMNPDFIKSTSLGLQPLNEVYFSQDYSYAIAKYTNLQYTLILGFIALIILAIAGMNFMSLTLSRISGRQSEIGIRKASGALKNQLRGQVFGEIFVTCGIALLFGIVMAEVLAPFFRQIIQKPLPFNILGDPVSWLVLAGILVLITLITGIYPAFMITTQKASALFGSRRSAERIPTFVKGLIVVQFALSIAFLIMTFTMQKQMNLFLNKDLGFTPQNVISIEFNIRDSTATQLARQYQRQAQQLQSVEQVSMTDGRYNTLLSDGIGMVSMRTSSSIQAFRNSGILIQFIDEHYLETMGIPLLKGNTFSPDRQSEITNGIIVNQQFVDAMGWENPVGQVINDPGGEGWDGPMNGKKVIGVVADYHFEPLNSGLQPVLLQHFEAESYAEPATILAKVRNDRAGQSLKELTMLWNQLLPQQPFNYKFMDDLLASQYQSEQRWSTIMKLASVATVLLACFGLFGLAALAAQRRTKEIGIRKVLGATVSNIVGLLSKDFLKLVSLGFIIAVPIAYYGMNQWLADFAYKIEIGPGIFLLAGGLALLIALATVSWQSIRAALANPVDSLRSE